MKQRWFDYGGYALFNHDEKEFETREWIIGDFT